MNPTAFTLEVLILLCGLAVAVISVICMWGVAYSVGRTIVEQRNWASEAFKRVADHASNIQMRLDTAGIPQDSNECVLWRAELDRLRAIAKGSVDDAIARQRKNGKG